MADKQLRIPVEHDLRPAYYDRFHCLMGDCVYNCCQDSWRINFSKKDYLALKRLDCSSVLSEKLNQTLRRVKGETRSEENYGEFIAAGGKGHCPLQREDGLCSLQLEKGADVLPRVCRIFPRGGRYMPSGYLEHSLSPACEGVLELLWNLPEGVDFVSDPLPKREHRGVKPNNSLQSRFQDIRSQCIDFLQDRRYPLPRRILLMGLALKELADGETDVDRWLARAGSLMENPELAGQPGQTDLSRTLPLLLSNNLRVLTAVTDRRDDFASVRGDLLNALGVRLQLGSTKIDAKAGPYLAAQKRFEENFADHDFFLENLMVSLFFHLHLPDLSSTEELWKSYVNFCNLYSFYRFMAVMSCREGASGDKAELFRLMVCASRGLLHNGPRQVHFRDELFQHDSATLAHMAVLLSG